MRYGSCIASFPPPPPQHLVHIFQQKGYFGQNIKGIAVLML
jgi:hypothetical protein